MGHASTRNTNGAVLVLRGSTVATLQIAPVIGENSVKNFPLLQTDPVFIDVAESACRLYKVVLDFCHQPWRAHAAPSGGTSGQRPRTRSRALGDVIRAAA